jgi:hypothetical protein
MECEPSSGTGFSLATSYALHVHCIRTHCYCSFRVVESLLVVLDLDDILDGVRLFLAYRIVPSLTDLVPTD